VLSILEKNAYAECANLLNLEVRNNLVPQSKLMSQRSTEYFKSMENLVKVQDDENFDLHNRVENVDMLLKQAMSNFILKTKDWILNMENGDPQIKEFQKQGYADAVACLDEIDKILQRIRVKYTNAFDEDAVRVKPEITPLDNAVNNVMNQVAKLRALPPTTPEDDRVTVAEGVPKLTKTAIGEFTNYGATPDQKQEFVSAVKQARDGEHPSDFFEAQDAVADLLNKVKMSKPITIDMPEFQEAVSINDDAGDLLEMAKRMCAALKNLNLALDD